MAAGVYGVPVAGLVSSRRANPLKLVPGSNNTSGASVPPNAAHPLRKKMPPSVMMLESSPASMSVFTPTMGPLAPAATASPTQYDSFAFLLLTKIDDVMFGGRALTQFTVELQLRSCQSP